MSNKKTRKPRSKIIKTKPDLGIPIPMELLGTDEDPCFGKLFDPRVDECKRCGDSEICAIAMGQKNHLLRKGIEEDKAFKDLEELEIKPTKDKKEIRRLVKKRIRGMVKMAGGEWVDQALVVDDVFASYNKDGYTQIRIRKIIKGMVEKSNSLISKNHKLKWNR